MPLDKVLLEVERLDLVLGDDYLNVGNPFREVPAASVRRVARNPAVRAIAEEVYAGGLEEDLRLLADELERLGCPAPEVVDHCRSPGPHVRGCWAVDLILRTPAEPPPAVTARPAATGRPAAAGRVREVRAALAEYLGPKKYRRALRKAVGRPHSPGRVERPEEWDRFVRLHPGYDVPDEQLAEVFAVCTVHGCELEERPARGPAGDAALARDPIFLEARGTRFPHAHPDAAEGGWELVVWWCPACQRVREEWVAERGEPAPGPAARVAPPAPSPAAPVRVGRAVPPYEGPVEEVELTPPHTAGPAAAIAFLVGHLARGGHLGTASPEDVERQVARRERLGTTAVGRGLAVPNCTIPGVPRAVVLRGRCAEPIDWPGSLDGGPVRVVCLVVSPDGWSTLGALEAAVRSHAEPDRG